MARVAAGIGSLEAQQEAVKMFMPDLHGILDEKEVPLLMQAKLAMRYCSESPQEPC